MGNIDEYILSAETWPLTKEYMHKLRVVQKAMERVMLAISLVGRILKLENTTAHKSPYNQTREAPGRY